MDRLAGRKLEVELCRHRPALKSWVIHRIAATPDVTDVEIEATAWFHELPLDERTRLVADLARLNVKKVDLYEIATGPLGVLFTRFPGLFEGKETVLVPIEDDQEAKKNLAVTIAAMNELEEEDPAWFENWTTFEYQLEDTAWTNF